MKRRDLVKLLLKAGYKLERDDGDHTIYKTRQPLRSGSKAPGTERADSESNPQSCGSKIKMNFTPPALRASYYNRNHKFNSI